MSSSDRFHDDTVIVTGSTRGIGAGIARRFADEGASVVVTGRTESQGAAVVAEIRDGGGKAEFVRADMREPDAIRSLVDATADEFGGIDVLVNNAAVQTDTGVEDATADDWDLVVETDFRAYWLCAKYATEHMDAGSIVNVSSNHAVVTQPGIFPYNAVKAGINGMTRAMALDLGPAIRANTITSGWVAVERTTGDMDPDRLAELEGKHPVGRLGRPADIAGTAAYLASSDAAYVTGESIMVDGGRSIVIEDDNLPDYRQRCDDDRNL